MTDFPTHLGRQLQFLHQSCASYDGGFFDEAIRMATVMRVLLHDTKHSTSLLKHLGFLPKGISSGVADYELSLRGALPAAA